MNKLTKVTAASVSALALTLAVASPALAWHPQGAIVKKVQNVTTNSALSDANDAATAVAAKPDDILKYVITVSNNGEIVNNDENDMVDTVLTDTLPAGVELVSNPSTRALSYKMDTIKPGASQTKEYTVKVVASTDGVIRNEACFDGDSAAHDNKQHGCDSASIKVTVPPTPVTPVTPVTPAAPAPATLPNTGPGEAIALAVASAFVGYAAYLLSLKFRSARSNG